jgi:hypothetical protein
MPTLHIEHAISDLDTWLGAFAKFEEARKDAGVRAHRVCQPADDDQHIVIQLDFDSIEEAEGWKDVLETRIWTNPEVAPALAGTPRARVLLEVEA